MIKILALDGGGIRGLMTAMVLQDIERRLPGADNVDLTQTNILHQHFDVIAGTSTGSILAAAICTGKSLQTIIDLYVDRGERIFKPALRKWGSRVTRTFSQGISHPKHDDKALQEELQSQFSNSRGPIKLGSALIKSRLLIQTFDATLHEPIVFKSKDPDVASDKRLPLWEIVKASASAPSYFPSHSLKYRRHNKAHAMIDGGVFANNPTMVALSEVFALGLDAQDDLLCVSLGTSEEKQEGISARKGRELGAAEWALPLIGVFMGGASRHVHSLAKRVLNSSGQSASEYLRFQMLTEKDIPMDEASKADIKRMTTLASDYISGFPGKKKIEQQHAKRGYDYATNLRALLQHFA